MTLSHKSRSDLLAEIRQAIATHVRFPPGIDLGRSYALESATEAVMRAVEKALSPPWCEECVTCEGAGRVACGCWEGCPSMNNCADCVGTGRRIREPVAS